MVDKMKNKELKRIHQTKRKRKKRREEKKSKSECAREKKKEASLAEGREVPYLLVPSRKDKERHLA